MKNRETDVAPFHPTSVRRPDLLRRLQNILQGRPSARRFLLGSLLVGTLTLETGCPNPCIAEDIQVGSAGTTIPNNASQCGDRTTSDTARPTTDTDGSSGTTMASESGTSDATTGDETSGTGTTTFETTSSTSSESTSSTSSPTTTSDVTVGTTTIGETESGTTEGPVCPDGLGGAEKPSDCPTGQIEIECGGEGEPSCYAKENNPNSYGCSIVGKNFNGVELIPTPGNGNDISPVDDTIVTNIQFLEDGHFSCEFKPVDNGFHEIRVKLINGKQETIIDTEVLAE